MYPTGTGIAEVLNIVFFLIDLVVVGGEAVANIPNHSMAIAQLSSPPDLCCHLCSQ
jgi:hypothetical protein